MPAEELGLAVVVAGFNKFMSDMKGMDKAIDGTARNWSSIGEEASAAFGKMQPVGTILAGISAAGVLAMGSFAKEAIAFNSQATLMEVAARSSGTAFDELHDAALQVGGDTRLVGVSASGAADSITGLYKAGLTTTEIFGDLNAYLNENAELSGALRASIDMAAASELNMAMAADVVSVSMATFGMSADEATGIADNFVMAADASVASVGDLAAAMANVGPTAAAFGWSLEDVNTALALLSTRGISGAEAGTALKSMMTNILRPTNDVVGALRELNIELYDEQGVMKSLPDIIGQLSDAMAGMTEEQKNSYVQTLAGTYGMKAMNTLLAEGTAGWGDMETAIASATSAQEVAAAKAASMEGQLEALAGTVETAKIALGEELLPALSSVVSSMTEMVDAFNALPKPAKKATASILAIGTAVTGAAGAFILMVPRIIQTAQAMGTMIGLGKDVGFALKLIGAGANVADLGLAGFAAQAISVVAPLAAMYAAMVALDSVYQPHIDNIIATTESYHAYVTNMQYAGREAEILTEAQWQLGGSTVDLTSGMGNLLHETHRLNAGQRMAVATTGELAIAEQALIEMEQQRQIETGLLTAALGTAGVAKAQALEVERAMALQMGETTTLAIVQEDAMVLLAMAYDAGALSEQDYIDAGMEVLAVNEDSVPGLEAVQEAVESATGGMYGLVASAEAIPGSMRGVVTAAEEASAAAEEMAKRQQKAWESFASSVQSAVASALSAYKSGNAEMLAEQQQGLAEMLWNQTDTMAAMGQITSDQAIGMKSAIADEYGIMVSDTELATSQLLGLYGDWAAGGETSADEIIGFIQNIGEETEALVGEEEQRIQTMIDQWQTMQEGVGEEGEAIASHYAAMQEGAGTLAKETATSAVVIAGSMDDVTVADGLMVDGTVESFNGVAASSGTMAADVVASTTVATGGVMELTDAIGALPAFTTVTIEVEIIGDAAALPESPQLLYYSMYEDLLQLIRDNPLELEALFDIGAGLGGLGAVAARRWLSPQKQLIADLKKTIKLNKDILAQDNVTQQQREIHMRYMTEAQARLVSEQRKLTQMEREALALEKQRQDLAFLQEQAKLLELIREHGLDAGAIMSGITLGIDADVGAIVQAMTVAMQAIVEQAEAELGISSPSRVFAAIGTQMMAGLEAGIASMVPVIQSQMQMAVQPLSLPGRSASPVTTNNEYNYHLTTQSVMRDGGLEMEWQSMEMATR